MTDASANLAAVVLCPRRPMWGPRRPAGSLKGQPTAEPRPAAQHPSLSIKLASAVTGRAAGMPSRVLGCPGPHYKPRRGGPGAASLLPGAVRSAPPPTPSARPTASLRTASRSASTYVRPARPGPRTPSPRGFARERRRRRGGGTTDGNGVVLFFFYDKT